jgi:hypothetical protein
MGFDLVYCIACVEKTTGLVRLDFTTTKRQKIVTPIVKRQITEMCAELGVSPKTVSSWSDKGGEFSKIELDKLVREHRFVRLGPSIENKNKIFQRVFYRILKNRQAINVKTAIKKAQNQMNKALGSLHKMSAEEIAEKVKNKEVDSLKKYNSTRKDHVSNTKTLSLEVGDYVRLLVKKAKAETFYKSYKNKTFTAQVFKILKKTKKAPYKYQVKEKGRYYLIDYLLKSAPRDTKSKDLIKGRDMIQTKVDKANEAREEKRFAKEIVEHHKHIKELKEKGGIALRDFDTRLKTINKIKNTHKQGDKLLVLLDEMQAEYETQQKLKGVPIKPRKPVKVVGFKYPKKLQDEGYDDAAHRKANLQDLKDELDLDQPESPKPKVKKRRVRKKPKPKPKPKNAPFFEQFGPGGEISTDEEVLPKPKRKLRKRIPKIDAITKQILLKEYNTQQNKLLRLQKQLSRAKGEKLNRIIRDMETEIKKGKVMTQMIKAKKYKNLKVNLNFFYQ